MKCTAADIITLSNAFAAHGGISVPPKLALPFGRFQRAVRAEAEVIGDAIAKMTDEHLLRDPEGKPIEIQLPNGATDRKVKDPEAYKKAVKEIRAQPVEIPGDPFPAADIFRGEVNSDLSAALIWAVKE